jgi:hypothetical protein
LRRPKGSLLGFHIVHELMQVYLSQQHRTGVDSGEVA